MLELFQFLNDEKCNMMDLNDRKEIITSIDDIISVTIDCINNIEKSGFVDVLDSIANTNAEILDYMNLLQNAKIDFNEHLFVEKEAGGGRGIDYFSNLPRHKWKQEKTEDTELTEDTSLFPEMTEETGSTEDISEETTEIPNDGLSPNDPASPEAISFQGHTL